MTGRNIFAERQRLAAIAANCWGMPVTPRAQALARIRLLDTFIPEISGEGGGVSEALHARFSDLMAEFTSRREGWEYVKCELINISNQCVCEPYRLSVERDFSALLKAHPDKPVQYAIDTLVGDEVADFRLRNPDTSPGDEMAPLCRYSPRFDMVMQAVSTLAGLIPYVTSSWEPERNRSG
ncbi:hypothetical protein [Enterobacter mori]|uniref:hypothetical protein n=1 Tax=Enterobacter mori TaxID=539813 RepID=UPI003B840D20